MYTLRRKGAYTIRLLSHLTPLSEVQLPPAVDRSPPVPAANCASAASLASSAPVEILPETFAALSPLSAPLLAPLSSLSRQRLIEQICAKPLLSASALMDWLARLVLSALTLDEQRQLFKVSPAFAPLVC